MYETYRVMGWPLFCTLQLRINYCSILQVQLPCVMWAEKSKSYYCFTVVTFNVTMADVKVCQNNCICRPVYVTGRLYPYLYLLV